METIHTPKNGLLSRLLHVVKKFWLVLVILLVLLLIVFGIRSIKHNNTSQKQLTSFSSTDGVFSVSHPRNWSVKIPSDGSAILATLVTDAVPTSSTIKPYIHIARSPSKGELEAEYATTMGKYKQLFKKMEILSETKEMVDGTPARKIVMNATL
jgi:hypothetical protein